MLQRRSDPIRSRARYQAVATAQPSRDQHSGVTAEPALSPGRRRISGCSRSRAGVVAPSVASLRLIMGAQVAVQRRGNHGAMLPTQSRGQFASRIVLQVLADVTN